MALSTTFQPPTGVIAAREMPLHSGVGAWSLDTLAGRFVEVTASAATSAITATARIILDAQQRGRLAAWIGDTHSCFFPPDLAATGIDLAALPVVRPVDALSAHRAADAFLRSGGFSVVVLDGGRDVDMTLGVQTRLSGLAKQHGTALLWIADTTKRSAINSLVSVRVDATRSRTGFNRFACEVVAVKDKRATPGWVHREVCRGTDGLC